MKRRLSVSFSEQRLGGKTSTPENLVQHSVSGKSIESDRFLPHTIRLDFVVVVISIFEIRKVGDAPTVRVLGLGACVRFGACGCGSGAGAGAGAEWVRCGCGCGCEAG